MKLALVLSFLLVINHSSIAKADQPKLAGARPNIIVILADDVGYSDIGCYGSEIETPNLDALAKTGIRFTQFYNTARCCPTRAALLTGLYAHQAGIGHMVDGAGPKLGVPAYAGELSHHAVTIAEVLKPSGYSSYVSGKWHVTGKTAPANLSAKRNWPLQRGFDRFYGTIHGAGSFFDPNTLTRDNQSISPFADSDYQPTEYYYTDAIGDHASKFITDHAKRKPDNPFFLYVAFTAAHWPMHAKEADIAKYKGRYDHGYDAIRAARLKKMEQLGLLDSRWQISRQAGDWDQVKNKEWETRCMEVFAAMLDSMDQSIGRLVNTLKQNDQYENTLILYLQDNGGCAEALGRNGNFQPKADGPTLPRMANDALQPSMIPKQTRDGFPVRQGTGVMPGAADTYISYGQGWANVSNTPFREYKHWQHEGGISSPLIAHWPKGISQERQGNLESRPSHLIDVMATCVDVTGATYPTDFESNTIEPMQGLSFASTFTNQDSLRSHPIFWEHEGNRAVRVGNWKLVSKHPGDWELYEVVSDRTEMTNIASEQPHRVAEMSSLWNEWAQRVGVLPWPLK